jgi:hypothetical protein
MESPMVDVLIPTSSSPLSLCATLASLAGQRYPAFRVIATSPDAEGGPQVDALLRLLELRGHPVVMAEPSDGHSASPTARRRELLDRSQARYALVVDDGVFLEPDLVGRLVAAIRSAGCGFVGSSVVDLRFRDEHHPDEEHIEFWDGPVRPEEIRVGQHGWERRRLHRGANLQHLRERLPRTRDRLYRVADVTGCVLYDTEKLRGAGGFRPSVDQGRDPAGRMASTWATPLRLRGRHGGAGLFPSGAYRLAPEAPGVEATPATLAPATAAMRWSTRLARAARPPRLPRLPGRRHGTASPVRRTPAPRYAAVRRLMGPGAG